MLFFEGKNWKESGDFAREELQPVRIGTDELHMTSRERVIRALSRLPVDRVPRHIMTVGVEPGEEPAEVAEIRWRYPMDIEWAQVEMPRSERARGKRGQVGQYVDDWGCTWEIREGSQRCRLIHSPLADIGKLARYQPPMEILKRWNLSSVNQQCAESPRFILAYCQGSMFQRLCWLRSRSAAVGDLRKDSKPVRKLVAMLHEFCRREVELWCGSDVDAIALHDAWWTEQPSIDGEIWRHVFKPIYRELCEMIRKADKFVFFDVQGPCLEVLPDLVEIGVDAVGADWLSMPMEQLAPEYREKITFWAGVGGRESVGQLTPDQAREAVRRLRRVLDGSQGGLIARYIWAPGTEFKNMVTFYEYWLEPASALAAAAEVQASGESQGFTGPATGGATGASKT